MGGALLVWRPRLIRVAGKSGGGASVRKGHVTLRDTLPATRMSVERPSSNAPNNNPIRPTIIVLYTKYRYIMYYQYQDLATNM